MLGLTIAGSLVVFAMLAGLTVRSLPVMREVPVWEILSSTAWRPLSGEFGMRAFIVGTLWVTGCAVLIAVPMSLLTAIYLSEYAGARVRQWAKPLIDVLAGIPSVVFGVWGMIAIVPFIKDHIAPAVGSYSSGYCVLAGGIVLAVMIVPVIIHVCLEVFESVAREMRDASLAVGATKWQTIRGVVLRKAMPGVIAAVVLGLSRAFGETMAVLMVVGNVPMEPHTVLDPAYPLPALIANNYGEMMSVPLYDSALLLSCLVLLVVVLIFNMASRAVLVRVERRTQ
jgi:phosphate transport system permease protein